MTASAEVRALRRAAPWDARFHERSPWFWPIAAAARRFAACQDWPEPEAYAERHALASVRFVTAPPVVRRARARQPSRLPDVYDARIVEQGTVLTRRGDWHDFLNALAWATFPRAKLALHVAQLDAIRRAKDDPTHVPGTRTRQHDALALLDEGGVVALQADCQAPLLIVFGHALYEGLVLGRTVMIARALPVPVPALPATDAERIARADEALVAFIQSAPVPEQLARFGLSVRAS